MASLKPWPRSIIFAAADSRGTSHSVTAPTVKLDLTELNMRKHMDQLIFSLIFAVVSG